MSAMELFFLFLTCVVGGVLLEVTVSQTHLLLTRTHFKSYHFSIARYIFLLLFPILGTLVIFFLTGVGVLRVFFISAFVGTLLEWFVGYAYHMVVGTRLWSYFRYNISSYTSFLSIPLWGLAGVLFWLLVKAL